MASSMVVQTSQTFVELFHMVSVQEMRYHKRQVELCKHEGCSHWMEGSI